MEIPVSFFNCSNFFFFFNETLDPIFLDFDRNWMLFNKLYWTNDSKHNPHNLIKWGEKKTKTKNAPWNGVFQKQQPSTTRRITIRVYIAKIYTKTNLLKMHSQTSHMGPHSHRYKYLKNFTGAMISLSAVSFNPRRFSCYSFLQSNQGLADYTFDPTWRLFSSYMIPYKDLLDCFCCQNTSSTLM